MIRVFKWWWAWNFETIEEWLEKMEAGGLRLVSTRFKGVLFYFEKCAYKKARYCIDFQTKLTPEYISIIKDDGWDLYQLGMGWYILRKEYQDDRPDLYTDFEGLITRNKHLLSLMISGLVIEVICFTDLIWNIVTFPSTEGLAYICLLGSLVLAFFTFAITSLAMQIKKLKEKRQ
jgi:hypothetical protein